MNEHIVSFFDTFSYTMKTARAAPAIGTALAGGFYAGRIRTATLAYDLIVAPRALELAAKRWNTTLKAVTGAGSSFDGAANTRAMAEAGSRLAKSILALSHEGHDDWYLPARDELELLYRAFKPTGNTNWCWRANNQSSDPVGYSYSREQPAQTALDAFRAGAAEAFASEWYWSSTQYAGAESAAWAQYFGTGTQDDFLKLNECRVRPVRRLPLRPFSASPR